ncbi:3'-5' exonuclease family protein [Ectopseudomonas oleovorans]|uniref:Excinuclease cho n=1 Tax=Ectopseudomonas oleovorans (strain CECT 5344) TaxID=1182590 RepID=W6R0C2_ECTO5|nr:MULTISPECIES: 3'-5' exonuclease family protein [Pseudomonas]MDH1683256.1 exonuclease domain-containing protein [Pseudomonas chengduensis]CDM41703.1 DNA polymerase III, epsilon subunit [Pseudomonas oleovorans CECT 5344]CDR92330.1 DNA polymerase III, epsilon subunit [Pseudomonas oleovorans]
MTATFAAAATLQGRALAVVEVKTTGVHPARDAIWELAIIQVDAEGCVAERLHWLFEPGVALPPQLLSLSGLHPLELSGQPRIDSEARAIADAIRGRVLMGHNLRFSLAFLRRVLPDWKTLRPPQLCILRLARATLPQLASAGFDALCAHFGITRFFRDRAVPDAEAVLTLAQHLLQQVAPTTLGQQLRSAARPPLLAAERFAQLPEHYFLGDGGAQLYVGKSRNLRRRVMSHFQNDHRDRRSLQMVQQIRDVQLAVTAGELGALLFESAEIKRLQPLYNRRLRKQRELLTWALAGEPGELHIELLQHHALRPGLRHVGLFRSRHQARQWLLEQARERRLCLRVLGLEEGEGACFAYQLGRCAGACCGEEPRSAHDRRLLAGAERLQTQAWPWNGPVALVERDEQHGLTQWHVLDQWRHLGTVDQLEHAQPLLAARRGGFNLDTYHILIGHLRRHPNMEIVPL